MAGTMGEDGWPVKIRRPFPLIPAKAGIQDWVPAFAGTSGR
jgi:hypothetical protein